jgi:hypothetical protein
MSPKEKLSDEEMSALIEKDPIKALCILVEEAGLTMTLYGDDYHEDEDELSAYGGDDDISCKVKVSNVGGSRVCIVHCIYDGTWSFAPSMLEEERKLPPWTFTIDQPDHKYSVRLVIESKDDELIYEKVENG